MNNIALLGLSLGALAGAGVGAAISQYCDLDGVETALAIGGGAVLGGAGGYLAANLLCPAEDPCGMVAAELELQQSQIAVAEYEKNQDMGPAGEIIDINDLNRLDNAADMSSDVNLETPNPISNIKLTEIINIENHPELFVMKNGQLANGCIIDTMMIKNNGGMENFMQTLTNNGIKIGYDMRIIEEVINTNPINFELLND